ncbi:hypothetical protein ACFPM0_15055 [Pseudonocardia sulfidoxydans]|uniref:hypothetical protein n=1 Tax=Pseudonocardia sulfidoxydans TaxID=54011 RepID=UPI0036239D84
MAPSALVALLFGYGCGSWRPTRTSPPPVVSDRASTLTDRPPRSTTRGSRRSREEDHPRRLRRARG